MESYWARIIDSNLPLLTTSIGETKKKIEIRQIYSYNAIPVFHVYLQNIHIYLTSVSAANLTSTDLVNLPVIDFYLKFRVVCRRYSWVCSRLSLSLNHYNEIQKHFNLFHYGPRYFVSTRHSKWQREGVKKNDEANDKPSNLVARRERVCNNSGDDSEFVIHHQHSGRPLQMPGFRILCSKRCCRESLRASNAGWVRAVRMGDYNSRFRGDYRPQTYLAIPIRRSKH